ncbi:MAG: thioredoxin [Cryomorphaceae bacterium]|nr:thioredoxin [Cryomorphaceae bacterium]
MAKESFKEIINSETPVLIDFFAEWCGPCKAMAPELKKLSVMVVDRARVLKIDVDKNPAVAQAYQIRSIPTVMIFRRGAVEWRAAGFQTADQLLHAINALK